MLKVMLWSILAASLSNASNIPDTLTLILPQNGSIQAGPNATASIGFDNAPINGVGGFIINNTITLEFPNGTTLGGGTGQENAYCNKGADTGSQSSFSYTVEDAGVYAFTVQTTIFTFKNADCTGDNSTQVETIREAFTVASDSGTPSGSVSTTTVTFATEPTGGVRTSDAKQNTLNNILLLFILSLAVVV